MRLLHTAESRFETFTGRKPEYAILSHTWGEVEASCQTILEICSKASEDPYFSALSSDLPPELSSAGIQKILRCRLKARENGFDWVWIDTCCIDKSSSSELSEAINSMFNWYAESSVCYAYLVDVEPITQADWIYDHECKLSFESSRWWTRGWCLQELIAPRNVEFLASDWSDLGTKFSLRQLIREITGIRLEVLMGANLGACCGAEKMSWASTRDTTRPEDVAYCLLGLFGVNMPLMYGEGSTKAFIRLQKEILAQEPDYSLLAWSGPRTPWRVSADPTPALAVRPQQFRQDMSMVLVDLEKSRKGWSVVPSRARQPPVSMVRWEDLVFNPYMGHNLSHPRWLLDAIAAIQEPTKNGQPYVFYFVRDPTTITNRGLQARLFMSRIRLEDDQVGDVLSRTLTWTYIIHPDGLVCTWFGQRHLFSADIYFRDEAASLVLVPFKHLESAFESTSIYLRLPSPTEQQNRASREHATSSRTVLVVDDTVPESCLLVLEQYPDPITHRDSWPKRVHNPADLVDINLIGCCVVNCEPSSSMFVILIGEHSLTNQILLKTGPWDDDPTSTDPNAVEIPVEQYFKRWKEYLTLADGYSDQASFAPASGEGIVKLRVPTRPRNNTIQISMTYVKTHKARTLREVIPTNPSTFNFEFSQPAVAELEHEANVVFVPESWKRVDYKPFLRRDVGIRRSSTS